MPIVDPLSESVHVRVAPPRSPQRLPATVHLLLRSLLSRSRAQLRSSAQPTALLYPRLATSSCTSDDSLDQLRHYYDLPVSRMRISKTEEGLQKIPAMSSGEELENVEAVLEKAGKEPLQERELRELRRILYGKEAA